MECPNDNTGADDDAVPLGPTTHWSVILAVDDLAAPTRKAAQARFCRAYWFPVYAFIRRTGNPPHTAEHLTEAFFAWLIEQNNLAGLRQAGGPFRPFLLKALKHFLVNEGAHEG